MRIEKSILFKNVESATEFAEAIHNRLKRNLDYKNSRISINIDDASVTIVADSSAEIECDGGKRLIISTSALDNITKSFEEDMETIHLKYETDDQDFYVVGAINDHSTDTRRLMNIAKMNRDPSSETYPIITSNLHRTVIKSCGFHGAKMRTLHIDIVEKDSYLFDNLLDNIEKCGIKLENTSNRSATVSVNLEDTSYDGLVDYCKQMVRTIVSSWDSIHCPEHIRDADTVDNIIQLYNDPEKDKIDELMIPLIKLCNEKGYITVASCAGHGFVDTTYVKFKQDYGFVNLPTPWVLSGDTAYIKFIQDYDFSNVPCPWVLSGDVFIIQTPIGATSLYDVYIARIQAIRDLFNYFADLPDRKDEQHGRENE